MKATKLLCRVQRLHALPIRPVHIHAPIALKSTRLYVAAVDEQIVSFELPQLQDGAMFVTVKPLDKNVAGVDPQLVHELEIEELDAAQEQMFKWMAKGEKEQHEDLDEMVDHDEFGDEEYAEMLEEVEQQIEAANVELKVGDRVFGTVYEIDEDGAHVEIGQKCSGFVPLSECSFARLKTPLEVLRVGMQREFMVVEDEDDYEQVILSLAASESTVFWQRMRQMMEENMTVHARVESANRGGLFVKYCPYEGFVPVSHFGSQVNPETIESLVGGELPVKFLEVDEDTERLVFSNKRVAEANTMDMQGLKVGDLLEGVVQYIMPYGAFLDVGNGTVGLLHVSQISHDRVVSIDKILREGDRLKVLVLSLDAQRGRITLSTKKLEPTPGDMLRDPQLVFQKAEETAALLWKRVTDAEMAHYGAPVVSHGEPMGAGGDFNF